MDSHPSPPSGGPTDSELVHRTAVVSGVVVAIGAVVVLLWYLVDVLMLIFASVLLAILMRAPVDWIVRHSRLSPNRAQGLVLLAVAVVLGVGGWLFGKNVADQLTELGERLPQIVEDILTRMERYSWVIEYLRPREVLNGGASVGRGVDVLITTFGAISSFVIVVVIAIFLAFDPELYMRGALHLVPKRGRKRAQQVFDETGHILRRWMAGQSIMMVVVAIMTGIGLWLLDVPLALALALITGLLNFVPYVGPIVAAVPAILVALSENVALAGYVALLFVVVQSIEGYVLEPLVQQRAAYVPPAVVLGSQVILGILVGTVGVILATPLMAATITTVQMLYVENVLGEKKNGKK
jgi:predicted PurR-regulated permease PerM